MNDTLILYASLSVTHSGGIANSMASFLIKSNWQNDAAKRNRLLTSLPSIASEHCAQISLPPEPTATSREEEAEDTLHHAVIYNQCSWLAPSRGRCPDTESPRHHLSNANAGLASNATFTYHDKELAEPRSCGGRHRTLLAGGEMDVGRALPCGYGTRGSKEQAML